MSRFDRREFLSALARSGAGACGLGLCGGAMVPRAAAKSFRPTPGQRTVDFFETRPDGRVVCGVCPHRCVLGEGKTGFCRSRTNVGGVSYPRGYGTPCIIRVDPVEKIPLNHFLPGVKTMTIAPGGCNLRCLYCQNWQQAQARPDEVTQYELSPDEAIAAARKKGVRIIAFNYTEPVAFLEYAKDIARAARKAEIRVVAASGGYIETEPLLDLAQHVDAFTIGLKGYTDAFYDTMCSARLEPVLRTLETLREKTDCWLEIVNLIVPTYNDDLRVIRKMVGWIRRTVGVATPLHFARFVPMYRLANLPRTPVETLEGARNIALRAGMRYVYTSNIAPHVGNNTWCPKCNASLIQRLGFKMLENQLQQTRCPQCHLTVPGVWA
jgi:pyruvate formate lyase activating enzyme